MKVYKFTLFFLFLSFMATSQTSITTNQFMSVQTGFALNNYNASGIRLFLEYQKEINKKYSYGISYEHTRFVGHTMTDYYPGINADLDLLDFNYYYRIGIYKDYIYWKLGVGAGVFHAGWATSKGSNRDKLSYNLNASLSLNIKLSNSVYIEMMPIPVLFPINRLYYSSVKIKSVNNFYAYNFFPIGIKIKL